jgi:tetratricopeptide (TPR) repeat protein
VSSLDLRDNAHYLLQEIFQREEDRDGETIVGSRYGEGFYQRGRFLMAQKEPTRALRQFQNAFNYDPRHFLAINEMGEYYKSLNDYDRAYEYFDEARKTYEKFYRDYGSRPEDETLREGDYGKLFYNMGSLSFLRYAGVPADAEQGFPGRRIYPDRAGRVETEAMRERRQQLRRSREYFDRAFAEGIKDQLARVEMKYWSGWIDYIDADFEGALQQWETIDTEYTYPDPVLLMSLGNAYYYTDQMRAALGNYLKIQSDFETRAAEFPRPNPEDRDHREVFFTLAAAYNNIGAVYEKEFFELAAQGAPPATLRQLEQKALQNYWAAIQASRKIGEDNEIARTNNQLAFKYLKTSEVGAPREPLLDDWVSPLLITTRQQQAERRR